MFSDAVMVLKCKLGHLVSRNFTKLKQIIFSSTRGLSFNNEMLTQSRDIGYDFEKLIFTGENLTSITCPHHSTCFLVFSFSCFVTSDLIGRNFLASFSR